TEGGAVVFSAGGSAITVHPTDLITRGGHVEQARAAGATQVTEAPHVTEAPQVTEAPVGSGSVQVTPEAVLRETLKPVAAALAHLDTLGGDVTRARAAVTEFREAVETWSKAGQPGDPTVATALAEGYRQATAMVGADLDAIGDHTRELGNAAGQIREFVVAMPEHQAPAKPATTQGYVEQRGGLQAGSRVFVPAEADIVEGVFREAPAPQEAVHQLAAELAVGVPADVGEEPTPVWGAPPGDHLLVAYSGRQHGLPPGVIEVAEEHGENGMPQRHVVVQEPLEPANHRVTRPLVLDPELHPVDPDVPARARAERS